MTRDAFKVNLAHSAAEDLDSIPVKFRSQIIEAIKSLSNGPFPTGVSIKRLKGFRPPLYRLRSGNYRVLYRIEGSTVIVMRVIDRKDLEKIIRRLHL